MWRWRWQGRVRGVIVWAIVAGLITAVMACSGDSPTPITWVDSVGSITCAPDGAHVTSPVGVQPDGVHFLVSAPEDQTAIVGDGLGNEPDEWLSGTGQAVSTMLGTGRYEVACRDGDTDRVAPVRAPLEIIDPGGIWVEDRLRCADWSMGITDYAEGAQGEHGDLVVALRRHVTGLRPGDLVTPAGYPATAAREIRVVRDGAVVAVATYEQREPGNWLLSTFAVCASSGLRG